MYNFYNFLRKKWSEYSEASGRKGTVVDEICVKPTGLIMGDFYNSLTDQRRVNDISQWESWTEDEMDFFGGKFFLPRIDGEFAFGSARIWFDEKKNITISEDARFITSGGFKFEARMPRKVSRSAFNNSTDTFGLYYIDVPIIAITKGNEYNAIEGEITSIEGIDFTYKTVSNVESIQNGSRHESNEEYYDRLRYAINDRSLMTRASMMAGLPEIFPVINSMNIVGPGDRYMTRDLVSGGDISRPAQKADYLGKTTGESLVKSLAFSTIFPPNSGSFQKEDWGPFSIQTDYQFPLTIDPSSLTASISNDGQLGDPAFNGYDLNQEFDNEKYRNLYFDDYKLSAEIETTDLFNIQDEDVGFTKVTVPDGDWIYGSISGTKGNMGQLWGEDISANDILYFLNNDIVLAGGAKTGISVGKDIEKRIGIKLTGTISIPSISDNVKKSSIELIVGGVNYTSTNNRVDGYTGIGFGIHIIRDFTADSEETNVAVYFGHREKYGTSQVFGADEDFIGGGPYGHIAITNLGALAEKLWRMQPGIEYDFEFIVHDDLRLTLYLYKNDQRIAFDEDERENSLHFELSSKVLSKWAQEIYNKNTDRYGTTMKITLDTNSQSTSDQWIIGDLKAFDTQASRATALFAINVKGIEDPISLYLRAFGYGATAGVFTEGYSAYIWDKETQTIASGETDLTSGGWSVLDKISNPGGATNVLQSLLRQDIQNLDRYRVQSRYGENIFVMIAASGTSKFASLYFGESQDDIQSKLQIDYIKLQSGTEDMYHANNKVDIYVATVKNTTDLQESTVVLTKGSGNNFFEMNEEAGAEMPVDEITAVMLGSETAGSEILSNTEYTIIRPDPLLQGSSKETIMIVLDGYSDQSITVRYTTYPEVKNIQDYFDGNTFGKLFGDILVKHKTPIYLSFILYYTGNTNDDQMVDEIKKYVDDNIDGTFSVQEMIRYLYEEKLASRVTEPVEISYERTNDDGEIETGKFTTTLTARDIDYFRIRDLTVNRL